MAFIDDEPEDDDVLELTDEVQEEEEQDSPVGFAFEDSEEEPEAVEETPRMKELRKQLREAHRTIRKYEVEPPAPKQKIQLGARPTWGDGDMWDYDSDKFDAALEAWLKDKSAYDQQEAEETKAKQTVEQEGNAIAEAYHARVKALALPDYDESLSAVEDELGPQKMNLLVAALPEAEKMIDALAKSPGKLKLLANITNMPRFVYEVSKLEGKVSPKMGRKAPAPDAPVRGNAGTTAGDNTLKRLEAEADKTGDRSKLIAYKASKRN